MLEPKRIKSCSVCGEQYSPRVTTQKVCGIKCAAAYSQKKRWRKEAQEYRKATETKASLRAKAQSAVNSYIRERDQGGCIACGTTNSNDGITGSSWDAGHYRSRGSAPGMRFHLLNVWKCCTRCNRELSGNIVEMRKGLVERLGEARVQELECDNRLPDYSKDDLRRIAKIFRKRARFYRKLREAQQ